jgi:prepilin-type N-terminal cleavage/methylation domain-containing protein
MNAASVSHRCLRKATLRKSSGFTLLEALIAISIAAMALGALSRAVTQGVKSAGDTANRQQAAMVASAVLGSGTFVEDFLRSVQGESAPWAWRVSANPQPLTLHDQDGHAADQTLLAAQLTVEVFLAGQPQPIYVLRAWKPYRTPL